MRIVVITGASSGIGAEFARQLDKEGWFDSFLLIARREDRLLELSGQLRHPSRILAKDITENGFPDTLLKELEDSKAQIRMLINCAGYGIAGHFAERNLTEQTGMVLLNCAALTNVTGVCIPFCESKCRILQAASAAAFLPQPGFAVYAATKAFVLSFSRALGAELRDRQITVTAFCPGPVDTEFFDIAEKYQKSAFLKKKIMLPASVVVSEVIAAAKRKQKVVIPGVLMKLLGVGAKIVPHSWILHFMK